ncbi:NAD-glutamate dehydrogenase domain-containing protein [Gordonia sp. (in: high G+C Gram-positive bacteria)]|uniref:NAD-glutamate dehydrogenase domain-containing protein n=1 Tax=Gordonia sp. (in: high G+C Gram-positive bacteria) TaxID=84139 RepID=UPI0039E406F2
MTTSRAHSSEAAAQLRAAGAMPDVPELREFAEAGRVRTDGDPVVHVSHAAGRTRVYVVTDDMPMLVEAVLATVGDAGLRVESVDHPIVSARRSPDGELLALAARDGGADESWICVRARGGGESGDGLERRIARSLAAVTAIHADHPAMLDALASSADDVDDAETATLLRWLADGNFTPLGESSADARRGIYRTAERAQNLAERAQNLAERARLARTYLPTGVVRTDYPIVLDLPGEDHRFVGLLSTAGLSQSAFDVPVVRRLAAEVFDGAEIDLDSFVGEEMVAYLQAYPLAELFATPPDELARRLRALLHSSAAAALDVFIRVDGPARTAAALVYLPRERYSTTTRLRLQELITEELGGSDVEYAGHVGDGPRALLHVLMHIDTDVDGAAYATGRPAQEELRARLAEVIATWDERLAARIPADADDEHTAGLLAFASSVSPTYQELRDPARAYDDLVRLQSMAPGDVAVTAPDEDTVVLYLCGDSADLTDLLPVFDSLGVRVSEEQALQIDRPDGVACWAYDFAVSLPDEPDPDRPDDHRTERLIDAFEAIWRGDAELDPFNALVLGAGLTWREAAILRAYHRYLRQCGFAYRAAYVADVLAQYRDVTAALLGLFEATFDPELAADDHRVAASARLDAAAAKVLGLDADRVLSALQSAVRATLRTNAYVTRDYSPGVRRALVFKLAPQQIPLAPAPRPRFELYVHSPRVEGVHLRFGTVARGGLRWSDRREDYRTEILGLAKAQSVKNAVIVPLGAKGGFVVKNGREPTREAVVGRYREFIAALLDVTDNLDAATGEIVTPEGVVRRDGDDPYLVVAADKGTASLSDDANAVAADYGFWLGDAFASGGSVGYDHKEMGITARGAWIAVQRHFAELGINPQTQDITVVGIGDMSGDVFGNGMLCSEHIRLIGAFDHRHVFLDPDPDAAASFRERKRMFALPHSSWEDYDASLISAGGGVYSRERKSIPLTPQVRAALGIDGDVEELAPPDLIRAMLRAPVDLLWNGGIGTYVKASTQSNAEVGDKANDGVRVDADQLRATVVGEGGNLGVTELGRIEADLHEVAINTDAMDNSAGVDCSDHEVNLKILLQHALASGALAASDRAALLASLTDDIAAAVLADNTAQNNELGFERSQATRYVDTHMRMLADLADRRRIDLALEGLPTPDRLHERFTSTGASGRARALTSPELATLMALVKLGLKSDLLDSDLPDSDVFRRRLRDYFPSTVVTRFPDELDGHRLRREIVVTSVVNDVVDLGGLSHVFRLGEGSGIGPVDAVRAFAVVTEVYDLLPLWERVVGSGASTAVIDEMSYYSRRLLFRASRWFLAVRPQPLALGAEVARYRDRVAELQPRLYGWLGRASRLDVDERTRRLTDEGVEDDLAARVALSLHSYALLDIVDVAEITDRDVDEVGAMYWALCERLTVEQLLTAVTALQAHDRWQVQARLAIRDDLHGVLRTLTQTVLAQAEPGEDAEAQLSEWELRNAPRLARIRTTIAQVRESDDVGFASLSVAARALRSIAF